MPVRRRMFFFNASTAAYLVQPHTFPYLVDKFFYTGAVRDGCPGPVCRRPDGGDRWFKMFEFFEVPSQDDRGHRPGRPGDQFRLGPGRTPSRAC